MTGDRFERQADLVPQQRLQATRISVVGVGAIGRQVALQLAAIGARQIQLIDHDVVEAVNVTTQGYLHGDVGQPKVQATAQAIAHIDPAAGVETVCARWSPHLRLGPAVFCCVDSISVRAAVWRSISTRCDFWADGRMRGEVLRVLSASDPESRRHYGTTLFSPDEAQTGACTARSTIYTAGIAAGLMLHQFTRWLRDIPVDRDLSLNLLASEWTLS